MSKEPEFTDNYLELKLKERLASALSFVSRLTAEDVLRCDGGCITELVREFSVAPPILRADLMVADQRLIELDDLAIERKSGATGHIFLIPVERDAQWLEGVSVQRTPIDDAPLAFLKKERNQISIRLKLSPEDSEGTLPRDLNYRVELLGQYVSFVGDKIKDFNKDLAEKMAVELNKRKSSITKAQKELDALNLPRVHNPEHQETAVKIDQLLRGLGNRVTNTPPSYEEAKSGEIRTFIVHGHDHQTMLELKDYVQNTLKLGQPIVLRQMPGLGKTLIEKFEREAELVELVFVLLTPDDKAAAITDPDNEKRRARQNVIFELGFFLGKLGRSSGRILLLHRGAVEIPSDISGVEYIDITNGIEGAGEQIRRELDACGLLNGPAPVSSTKSSSPLIVSYNGGKYDHKQLDIGTITLRVIRLQLENTGERDIEGIKVKAERFNGISGVVNQVPLRIQHDEYNHKRNGFSLSPGEKEMIDVVERQLGSPTVHLCSSLSSQMVTQEDSFKITVVITAEGQPKQTKKLRISKDETTLLRCDALK